MDDSFGPFEFSQCLGRGGMAEVWRATYRRGSGFAKEVAVKRILVERLGDPEIVTAFEDEARLCSRLHHPSIVEVYDHGRIDGVPFLSMELIEGVGLDDVLWACRRRATPMPHQAVVELGLQACDGLAYVHTAVDVDGRPLGLVHRDLKPANIMVDRSGRIRLLDFGVAKAATNQFLTRTDVIRGTPCYLSPETCSGKPAGPRSDLFALASILAEAVLGNRIFLEENNIATLQRIAAVDLRDTLERVTAFNPALSDCLAHAFERDPADRTPDARTFKLELLEAVTGPTGPHLLLGAVEQACGDSAPSLASLAIPNNEAFVSEPIIEAQVYLDEATPPPTPAQVATTLEAAERVIPSQAGLLAMETRPPHPAFDTATSLSGETRLWLALVVLVAINLVLTGAFFFETPGELLSWLHGVLALPPSAAIAGS